MAAAKDPADQVEAGRKVLDELRLEEEWEQVWKTALKQTVNPPTITHRHHTSDALADGTVVQLASGSSTAGGTLDGPLPGLPDGVRGWAIGRPDDDIVAAADALAG